MGTKDLVYTILKQAGIEILNLLKTDAFINY